MPVEKKFGRYIYRKNLGKGGMGVVIQAHDPQTKRDVAIKVLPPQVLAQPESLTRFQREAETIARLEHPAIVPVYDYGIEVGRPFLVMRLMTGGSLADRIAQGPIPLPRAVKSLKQMAEAIDYAHSKGVIHRDVKPTNILFDENGNAYLADFGIMAYMSGSTQTDLTKTTGSGLGTPDYMSPEQAKAVDRLDHLTDVYSFGVVIFEMLTGTLPFPADTPLGIAIAHMTKPVPRILDLNNNLPADCDTVIQGAMAKDKADRYQTASAVVADLEAALQGKPLSMIAPTPMQRTPSSPPTRPKQTTRAAVPPPPKKKTPWIGIVAAMLLLLGICAAAAFWANTQLNDEDGVATTTETPAPTQAAVAAVVHTNPVGANPVDEPAEANQLLPTNTPPAPPTDMPAPTETSLPTNTPEPSPTSLPTFTPTPVSIPQFYDSFDAGLSAEWKYEGDDVGDWISANGRLLSNNQFPGTLWVGNENWSNYIVEFEVIEVIGRNDTWTCDLIVAYTEQLGGVTLQMTPRGNVRWADIPKAEIGDFTPPYNVMVQLQDSMITTYINNEQKHQMNFAPHNKGKIGLICSDAGSEFDNFYSYTIELANSALLLVHSRSGDSLRLNQR